MQPTEGLMEIKKELVILKSSALDTSFETRIIEIQNNSIVLKNPVPMESIGAFIGAEKYLLQVRDLTFKGRSVEGSGVNMRFWLTESEPVDQLSSSKRKSDRTYFQDDENVYCEFTNPIDKITKLKKRMVDISQSGFSLITIGKSKLFKNGLQLKNVRIFGDIEEEITCDAEVRYSRNYISLSGESCNQVGLQITKKS
jgi:hypothetical protein